ncbi:MAG: type II secretion system protein GspJ [Candidatus Omnitrophota bacterium]
MKKEGNTPRFSSSAFTIAELLIAAAIFSVIALCLYSTLAGGIGVWRRQEKTFRSTDSVRLALDKIAKELRNSITYSTGTPSATGIDVGEELRFTGDKENVSFMTLIGSQIARVRYVFDRGAGGAGSLKRICIYQKDGFKKERAHEDTLLTGLEGATFSYAVDESEDGEEISWADAWGLDAQDKPPGMPRGVRIALTLRGVGSGAASEIFSKTVFMPLGGKAKARGAGSDGKK